MILKNSMSSLDDLREYAFGSKKAIRKLERCQNIPLDISAEEMLGDGVPPPPLNPPVLKRENAYIKERVDSTEMRVQRALKAKIKQLEGGLEYWKNQAIKMQYELDKMKEMVLKGM